MAASEARILANQANAKLSKGPTTPEGKEISRQNSYKHGMTGAGVVMSVEDAAEVERRSAAFQEELKPSGEVGLVLVRRAAFMSVQLDRSMARDNDATAERVRRIEADFVAPDGVNAAEGERLKAVARRQATFDPSPEAALARKYEAAAERGLYRALKELRQVEKASRPVAPAMDMETFRQTVASFEKSDREHDAWMTKMEKSLDLPPYQPGMKPQPTYSTPIDDIFDVPIAIGKRR